MWIVGLDEDGPRVAELDGTERGTARPSGKWAAGYTPRKRRDHP